MALDRSGSGTGVRRVRWEYEDIDFRRLFAAPAGQGPLAVAALRLLPWRRLAFDCSLSPDALQRALAAALEEERMGPGWYLTTNGARFRMVRQVAGASGAQTLVVVSGACSPTAFGSRVAMTVRSPISAIAFFVYFATCAIAGGIATTVSATAHGGLVSLLVSMLFASVMPVFAWSIVARQLVPEVRLAADFLRGAFPRPLPSTGPFR